MGYITPLLLYRRIAREPAWELSDFPLEIKHLLFTFYIIKIYASTEARNQGPVVY